ncbi:hypothetical protein EWH23_02795 [Meiothermus sp. PNK-Is4]|uniref:hypothetical protein n=1 Tax=Meiothermus sp. PNK-Is4 TaxID=2740565 RepID=UPI0010205BE6|nr:hypothetical protein [Meiothermus sp. PNK-Is4]RYM39435.1 hypothetical protein EWH23_02795 [Meiothermus sp. PNK-Is4]
MRRIDDPIALRDCLSRLSDPANLSVAQARLLLASRGLRASAKAIKAALGLPAARPRANPRPRLKPLDDLPLTPKEREIMERLRKESGWTQRGTSKF